MKVLLHAGHRISRAVAYGALIVAGFASFSHMNVALGVSIAVRVVALFLIVGSSIGLYGYVRHEAHIEIVGYPLLIMGMSVLSLSVFMGGVGQEPRVVIGTLLTSFTAEIFARYRDLEALRNIGDAIQEGGNGAHGSNI